MFDCVDEDTECTKDKLGYQAIAHLHGLIDDDHNGNVDQMESDEFLRDELQYTDGFERHSLFHNNDKLISVEDLWRAWKFSKVYNWTKEDVVDWLQNEVELPQYSAIFTDNAVTGSFLPRMATSNTFISTILGIKNPLHKQKLTLKSMDTVLFGPPPRRHSYIKDLVLMVSLILAVGGCWFGVAHHRYSQAQVRKMTVDLEALQKAEDALTEMQKKLEDAENRQISAVSSDLPDGQDSMGYGGEEGTEQIREELAATLLALQQAETQLGHSWAPPGQLQAWLQLTHELELGHHTHKRQAAERQFQAAKESCEKIKRRNRAVFGSLRMAHSNSLDEIDQRIFDAKMALEEVKQDLQERLQRWHTIEHLCGFPERLQRWHTIERLCGFPVITNPGLTTLQQMLYSNKEGGSSRLMAQTSAGSGSLEEVEEEQRPAGYSTLPTVPSKQFLRQRVVMGSTASLSQVSRTGVGALYPSSQPPHLLRRGSQDPDTILNHSEHLQDPASAVNYGLPYSLSAANTAILTGRARSTSITPSVASSTALPHHPSCHGYMGMTSEGHTGLVMGSVSRSMSMDNSIDDNLSQATLDSLTPSQSGGVNNNGMDHVSHSQLLGPDGAVLNPRLQKKPSMRKKVMSMFKKTPKKAS
ncbi:hypothetical protein ACOMHN_002153 [Nucella lapillus]